MKKVKTILTAAILLFSTLSFASDGDKVTEKVRVAFLNDFSAASNVSWEVTNDYYFATFTINQTEINAAYDETGELIGISRTIGSSQLPLSVSLALTKKYEGYAISKKAIELAFEGSTRYYLTIANESRILKLKCSANGDIQVERKIKKK